MAEAKPEMLSGTKRNTAKSCSMCFLKTLPPCGETELDLTEGCFCLQVVSIYTCVQKALLFD